MVNWDKMLINVDISGYYQRSDDVEEISISCSYFDN